MLRIAASRSRFLAMNRPLWPENTARRFLSSRPLRREVTPSERAALRAARKERAAKTLQEQGVAAAAASAAKPKSLTMSRWIWYAGIGVPAVLLIWGIGDENSPPAKFSSMIGLTALIRSFTDEIAKPSFDKLLPDWSQVRLELEPIGATGNVYSSLS